MNIIIIFGDKYSSSLLRRRRPQWSQGQLQREQRSVLTSSTGRDVPISDNPALWSFSSTQHCDHGMDLPTGHPLGLVWGGLALLCRFFIVIALLPNESRVSKVSIFPVLAYQKILVKSFCNVYPPWMIKSTLLSRNCWLVQAFVHVFCWPGKM